MNKSSDLEFASESRSKRTLWMSISLFLSMVALQYLITRWITFIISPYGGTGVSLLELMPAIPVPILSISIGIFAIRQKNRWLWIHSITFGIVAIFTGLLLGTIGIYMLMVLHSL